MVFSVYHKVVMAIGGYVICVIILMNDVYNEHPLSALLLFLISFCFSLVGLAGISKSELKTEENLFEQGINEILSSDDAVVIEELSDERFEVIAGGDIYIVYQIDEEIRYIEKKVDGEKVYPK